MSRAVIMLLSITFSVLSAGQALAQASGGTGGAVGQAGPMMSKIKHFFTGIGDPVSTYLLNTMFGSIFAGSTTKTILSVIAGPINLVVVVLAALLIIYNFIWGAASTAHEGELMGRRTHSFWAPVRMALAAMLLIPLPVIGGYNTGQALVAWLVKGSTATATYIWQTAATAITSGGVTTTGAINRGVSLEVAHAAWNMAVCEQAIASLTTYAQKPSDPAARAGAGAAMVWKGDGPWTAAQLHDSGFGTAAAATNQIFGKYHEFGQYIFVPVPADNSATLFSGCGAIATPGIPDDLAAGVFGMPSADSQATATFQAAHRDSIKSLLDSYRQPAKNLVDAVLSNKTNNATPPSYITDPLILANTQLSTAIDSVVATNQVSDQQVRDYLSGRDCASVGSDKPLPELSQACVSASWLGAGSYYLVMAQVSQKNIDLLTSASSVIVPASWVRDAANMSPYSWKDTVQVAGKYQEIARQADLLWRSGYGVTSPGGDPTPPMAIQDEKDKSSKDSASAEAMVKSDLSSLEAWIRGSVSWIFGGLNQFPVLKAVSFGQGLTSVLVPLMTAAVLTSLWVPGAAVFVGALALLLSVSGFLGYIVPLLPYVYWNLAVAGYVVIIAEAMFAAAVWAVAHIRTEGEGIAGSAQAGYMILLSLTLTPVLMVVGLFVGMAALAIGATLVNMTMGVAQNSLPSGSWAYFVGFLFIFVVFVYLYWMMIEKAFTLVGEFPSKILRWIGHNESPLTKGEEREARLAMAGAAYKIGGGAGSVATSAARKAAEIGKDYRDNRGKASK